MPSLLEELKEIEVAARSQLAEARDDAALEEWRIAYLGRRGRLTLVLRALASLPLEERRKVGAEANRLKEALGAALAQRQAQLEEARLTAVMERGRLDVTLPGRPRAQGRLHPVTQTLRDVLHCFESMGFQVVEGPEVEWDRYNFEALRIPRDHPARDMWATLWVDYEKDGERSMLLRTHTSPNQVRYMEGHQPPIRIVVPGRVYRFEATDPIHDWMHTQVEGLAVDEGISMADLKGTLAEFVRRIFGADRKMFFHCDYFPFTEPSMGLLIDCVVCNGEGRLRDGQGCSTCKETGWIEVLGSGMVHPEILANVGYDAERYTGFAWGMGIERIAMLRYGVEDVRLFYQNDLRLLEQF
ncbi:MAG: phenylalanine--tRNA ligase subunit alpha [Chloroflexi bacterium]|nr:phenylalanine--tRNA ligase subunit alpha [Chloroflexota bacterium]